LGWICRDGPLLLGWSECRDAVGEVLLEKGRPTGRETESALEILKTRYARGEISKEEFEEKWKDILSVQDSRFTDKGH
jgi:hypothetical protein